MTAAALDARGLRYRYRTGQMTFTVELPDLTLAAGEVAVMTGMSGTGKSTLLECLALIRGGPGLQYRSLKLAGTEVGDLSARGRERLRARRIGFMPQTGGLQPYLTVRENLRLRARLARLAGAPGTPAAQLRRADPWLRQLGLAGLTARLPEQLSVGQRQRAVFVQALVHAPAVVLIDEPTSALDPPQARELFSLMAGIAAAGGTAVLAVTHDLAAVRDRGFAEYAARDVGAAGCVFARVAG